jgi:Virulence protein RhuM family
VSEKKNDLGEVVIYRTKDSKTALDVRLVGETVWLTQAQMAKLFERDQSVVSRHINSVFKEKELDQKSNMQKMHIAKSDKPVVFYSLDMIISVGYRVNSKRGTQFRIWATQTLKDHLVRGYTLNRQRFEKNARELEAALTLVRKTAGREALSGDQGRGLVDVISRYTQTFLLLQRYDEGLLTEPKGTAGGTLPATSEARSAVTTLKKDLISRREAGPLFGQELTQDSRPFSATWNKAYLVRRPIPVSNPRRRICCISSSRTIRSATATSASGHCCSWIF